MGRPRKEQEPTNTSVTPEVNGNKEEAKPKLDLIAYSIGRNPKGGGWSVYALKFNTNGDVGKPEVLTVADDKDLTVERFKIEVAKNLL